MSTNGTNRHGAGSSERGTRRAWCIPALHTGACLHARENENDPNRTYDEISDVSFYSCVRDDLNAAQFERRPGGLPPGIVLQ